MSICIETLTPTSILDIQHIITFIISLIYLRHDISSSIKIAPDQLTFEVHDFLVSTFYEAP